MKIHHIGYAVHDIKASEASFIILGYKKCSDIVEDDSRKVSILFMKKEGYLIELIAPLNEKSHMYTILKKMGSGPYHVCYEVESIDASIDRLLRNGYILVEKPCAAAAIENRKVAFLFNRDIGMLELLEG